MIVRVGIPSSFTRLTAAAVAIGARILVSSNAFWRNGALRPPQRDLFAGADVAIDSAGFVAMLLYGGYRWTAGAYVVLVKAIRPTWWAHRDYCCEPQIAKDRAEVLDRVRRTCGSLIECRNVADEHGVPHPMPVLQGWEADDYLGCADLMGDLPPLVGLGSVCRRPVSGADGLLAIVERLDRRLPRGVQPHLFGVKSQAISLLAGHPRIKSVDSMAWDNQARKLALLERRASGRRELPRGRNLEIRIAEMARWYGVQCTRLDRSSPLFAPVAAA